MSDLVERLRKVTLYPTGEDAIPEITVIMEAADEITRLEADVSRLRMELDSCKRWYDSSTDTAADIVIAENGRECTIDESITEHRTVSLFLFMNMS